MSIVKRLGVDMPQPDRIMYCDNGTFSNDMATYKNGKFIAFADFPKKEYEMTHVTKWFYMREYEDHLTSNGVRSFAISFDIAEDISESK